MLQLASSGSAESSGSSGRDISSSQRSFVPQFDVLSLLRICYRQWPLIVLCVAVTTMIGIAYMVVTKPRYTSSLLIMVDTQKSGLMTRSDTGGDRTLDPGLVESQLEIIGSDSVALQVVRDLKLTTDPEFVGDGPGLLSRLMPFGATATIRTEEELEQDAVSTLAGNVKVKRVGISYVLDVSYSGLDPVKTAKVANGIANAYMLGELEATYGSTRRASAWLQERIGDLRRQASEAELAVQKYKADHNIVDTTRGLMTEQQLSDVNSQLVATRVATAEAKARLDRVNEVAKDDISDATVADALKSEVITRLRAQYLDLSSKQADLAARFGEKHSAVINIRNQMAEIKVAARAELRRIAESIRSEYEIASAREKSIQTSLEVLVKESRKSNQDQVALRELESSAQTYRNLYDAFLQKFEESSREQTFPSSNDRVITAATPSFKPSWPKGKIIIPASVMLGLVAGFVVAVSRELLNNGFRNADDVNSYAGLEYLGTLPALNSRRNKVKRLRALLNPNAPVTLGEGDDVVRHTVLVPFSRFTETIRNVKVSLDIARGPGNAAVIGIISSVPHEGKTTFVANLAQLTAQMGHRTVLIDGDLHSPSLTQRLWGRTKSGLIDVLTGTKRLEEVIVTDHVTGLDFIPVALLDRKPNTVALLTSPAMQSLLDVARNHYDYIFVDLPPVVPVVDARAAAHMFDSFVFVIEWSRTSRDVVRDAMLQSEQVRQRVVGAILNKADPIELKRIESYRGANYGSYYIDPNA